MDRKRLVQVTVVGSALLVVVAVAVLPWRHVLALPDSVRIAGRPIYPQPIGTHLYQMDLPSFLAGLLILATLAAMAVLVIDRGRWPSLVIFMSGCGIVMLTLFVQQSHATQIFIGSSQIQIGNTVALMAGLVIAIASASWIFQSNRSAHNAATA